jgi:hypothetical protein
MQANPVEAFTLWTTQHGKSYTNVRIDMEQQP